MGLFVSSGSSIRKFSDNIVYDLRFFFFAKFYVNQHLKESYVIKTISKVVHTYVNVLKL